MSEESKHAKLLYALDKMQRAMPYSARAQVLIDAERIIAEQERQLTWRPMTSAPRDGTEVLLVVESRAGIQGGMLVGHWMAGGHCIEDHPAIDSGWYFWNGCSFDKASKPLAWMPLPTYETTLAEQVNQ